MHNERNRINTMGYYPAGSSWYTLEYTNSFLDQISHSRFRRSIYFKNSKRNLNQMGCNPHFFLNIQNKEVIQMAYIIFEFNNNKFQLERSNSEVEKIFENLTGIKIEKISKKQIEDHNEKIISNEVSPKVKHPSVDDLVVLFKKQNNFEFGTELIRENFYPNLSKKEWRKAYYSIYNKINTAKELIGEQEGGHFIKRKEGKFTFFSFIKDNIPPLSEYEND